MKNTIKFSIIVPVYNVELYLEKCINSILNQTYKNYELILIDDGSTDSSGKICDNYIDCNQFIRVIHQANLGLSSARNKGIEIAKGQYIIFLDSDDYWYSDDVLSKLNDRLSFNEADVLSFNYIKFTDELFEKEYFENSTNMPLNIKGSTLKYLMDNELWIACAWNKAIKRELFLNNNLEFKNGITSEDIDWCLRLALYADKFDYINDIIVCYRQRQASISNSIDVIKTDTLIDNIENCLNILNNKKDKSEMLKPYVSYQYGTALYRVSTINNRNEYKRFVDRLKKNRSLLKWSDNKKIRLLNTACSIGGINFTLFLLKIRNKINKG